MKSFRRNVLFGLALVTGLLQGSVSNADSAVTVSVPNENRETAADQLRQLGVEFEAFENSEITVFRIERSQIKDDKLLGDIRAVGPSDGTSCLC